MIADCLRRLHIAGQTVASLEHKQGNMFYVSTLLQRPSPCHFSFILLRVYLPSLPLLSVPPIYFPCAASAPAPA